MRSSWIDRFSVKRRRISFLRQRTAAHVATQIRALRSAKDWSQKDLARVSGILQSTISRCERVDYGKQTISTLLRIAETFDVGMDISFVSFGELWKRERKLAREPLAPLSYEEEVAQRHQPKRVAALFYIADSPRFKPASIETSGQTGMVVGTSQQLGLWDLKDEVTAATVSERS